MLELQKWACPLLGSVWFEYGRELEIANNKLNGIKVDHDGGGSKEAMRRIVNHWLASSTNVCWERIISALEVMGEINLSERISKHVPS